MKTIPNKGDRVEAFSPDCKNWVRVTVIRTFAQTFHGEDKNFQIWKGLKKWRYPSSATPSTQPKKPPTQPLALGIEDLEFPLPIAEIQAVLGEKPQSMIAIAQSIDKTALPVLRGLQQLQSQGKAKVLQTGEWIAATPQGIRCDRPDAWFNPPQKRDYATEPTGQLTIFEAQPEDEPPDPDDFKSLAEFEAAWDEWERTLKDLQSCSENLDNLTSAQESVQGSPLPDCKSASSSLDSAKSIPIAEPSFLTDSPKSPSPGTSSEKTGELTGTDAAHLTPQSTSSPLPHPVSPSASKESDKEPQTSGIASPQCYEQSEKIARTTSQLKTSQGCSTVQKKGTTRKREATLAGSLEIWPRAGTLSNGSSSHQEALERPGLESDYFWLESPTALSSSGSGRPPGLSKLETQLQKLKAIAPGEVCNPVFLEVASGVPIGWTDPQDHRSALELLAEMERLENGVKPSEMPLTPELPQSHYSESSTLTHSRRARGQGTGNLCWGEANANNPKRKPTKQLYFEWEYNGARGKTYVRSQFKERVIRLNDCKAPVKDILALLTYNDKVKRVLGD
ncbi:MAG: hypothetical protein LRZ84_22870 [Desertifilum sp.]|nr:hypothetical protein [Desertifilum sp.]